LGGFVLQLISAKTLLRSLDTRIGWLIGVLSVFVVLLVGFLLLVGLPRSFAPFLSIEKSDVAWLPGLNASLNGASALLLSAGYYFIRQRHVRQHRFCMVAAFSLSAAFLLSYVVYHAVAGSTRFTGPDWLRPIYLTILVSHIILATLVIPLVLTTLYRAWWGKFVDHRRLARWTFPIWLYVSASGVVVYLLLYHWN
jgi:putative membrane protein